ncbi:helix-turn-helix transcriptional regulator [Marinobacter nauticus]|uniref:helix-turn-helix transcriptional regulator n=1 Tax=Marinobacter nauticus TaxID=2743 RepID=UPI000EADF59F|nr:helix-turn-helix transcriptional regulator [Marinobacter nauticus]RKR72574.1 DNA-binding CsgD family transcriptional regulator [Marinobacter nauticus]
MTSPHREGFFQHDYHELIGLIYDAVTAEQGFFPFLRRFIDIFHGHSASFAIYNTAENALLGAWTVNIPEQALEFYSEHVSHRDVLVERAMSFYQQGKCQFVASNLDLGPDVQRLRDETRAEEWLESYGASEAAGAVAYMEGHYLNFFGIQRSADQPAFSYEELRVFDGFLPHLHRAVDLYTRLMQKRCEPAVERLVLERVNRGIIICDASFRVVFQNAKADEILGRNVGLWINDEGMLAANGSESARRFAILLSLAVEASIARQDLDDQVLSLAHGRQRITLVVSPLLSGAGSGSSAQGALVTLHDLSWSPEIKEDLLQNLFELTDAEVAVASDLLHGQSLSDIAHTSGRSRETVKYHLNSIFRKTRTRRQGELVSLLSRACLSP